MRLLRNRWPLFLVISNKLSRGVKDLFSVTMRSLSTSQHEILSRTANWIECAFSNNYYFKTPTIFSTFLSPFSFEVRTRTYTAPSIDRPWTWVLHSRRTNLCRAVDCPRSRRIGRETRRTTTCGGEGAPQLRSVERLWSPLYPLSLDERGLVSVNKT